ncbi:hypothetical protein O3M35_013085 [Rhynocoris fuscipes]|uniref:Uncharacterized protein n=1 Tax=Rhynocoris fuscipes TaxID=488301 RepID=A0AAW1CH50_9HEMI
MMLLPYKSIVILICISLTGAQVLNGYINPLWMSDRRPKARSLYYGGQTSGLSSDYYMTRGGVYTDRPELRRVPEYYYMDELGRYRPVYRNDRLFRADDSRQYYSTAEQVPHKYVALPPNSPAIEHHDEQQHHETEEEAKLV